MSADTRKALAADMLATARALAARGVELPAMYVVSRGEPAYRCGYCGAKLDESRGCTAKKPCSEWPTEQTFPNKERVPNLADTKNADAALGLLRDEGVAYIATWVPEEHDNGGHHVAAFGHAAHRSPHLAHAAAKAWLAWLVWRAGRLLHVRDTKELP